MEMNVSATAKSNAAERVSHVLRTGRRLQPLHLLLNGRVAFKRSRRVVERGGHWIIGFISQIRTWRMTKAMRMPEAIFLPPSGN